MNSNLRIVYVASGDVSVYESQVLELLCFIKDKVKELILLQGFKSVEEKKVLQSKMSNFPYIRTIWFKSYPLYSIYENTAIKSLTSAIKKIEDFEECIYHVRAEYVGYLLKKICFNDDLKLRTLIDIRGVLLEELKYKYTYASLVRKILCCIQYQYLKRCYNHLFTKDDSPIKITSVSPLINDYLREYYPLCRYEMFFNPNIAGERFIYSLSKRIELRRKLGFNDDDVVAICSTGGNAVWQKDRLMVKYLVEKGVKVINLSKATLDLDNVVSKTIPFSEMPDYLSVADIAILWRDDTFMNNSASPSKFSEFACMGLYVIHNSSVEVATKHIVDSGSGLLLKSVNETFELNDIGFYSKMRSNWIEKGLQTFGIENIGKSYLSIYNTLYTK